MTHPTPAAPAQVLLRWALQQGLAVIPKSNNHQRLVQNLACTTFELSEEDMKTISGLNINLRVSHHPSHCVCVTVVV